MNTRPDAPGILPTTDGLDQADVSADMEIAIVFTGITLLDCSSDPSALAARLPRNDNDLRVDGFVIPPHRAYIMIPAAEFDESQSTPDLDPLEAKLKRGFFLGHSTPAYVFLLDGERVTIDGLIPLPPERKNVRQFLGAASPSASIIQLNDICEGQLDTTKKENPAFVSALAILPAASLMTGQPCSNLFTFKPPKEGSSQFPTVTPSKVIAAGYKATKPIRINLEMIDDPSSSRVIALNSSKLLGVEIGNAPLDAILETMGCHTGHTNYVDYHFALYQQLLTTPPRHEMPHIPYLTYQPSPMMEILGGPNCPPARY